MEKILFKKVCLIVSVLFAMSTQLLAQETSPRVTFKVSDRGKTLTIIGQGDLTTYQAKSDELKFSLKGAANVGTDNNPYNNKPVGTSAVYNAATPYYAYYPKKIASLYPDYAEATATYSWNEEKIGSLFHNEQKDNVWGWYKVELNDEVDLSGDWWSNYATDSEGKNRILISDFKNSDYFSATLSNVTFRDNMKQYLYVISDDKYVKLAEDAVYNENETYYSWDESSNIDATKVNFGAITETEMLRMGYLHRPIESLAQILNYKLKAAQYTTIQFVNVGAEALKIDKQIVLAILYPDKKANATLTQLDLGAATCADFSKETFASSGTAGSVVLETLTLPLCESKETPAEVVSCMQGNDNSTLKTVIIPEGYEKIGKQTFSGAVNLPQVILPTSLKEIGDQAFLTASSLTSINLTSATNLTYIGKQAFCGTALTSVSFPKNLDKIDDGAFMDLEIPNLNFNEKLRYIGNSAFALPSEQTEKVLMIPGSVRYIGPFAFNFRQYQDVYFQGTKAPLMPTGKSPYYEGWAKVLLSLLTP